MAGSLGALSHYVEDKLSALFYRVGKALAVRPMTAIIMSLIITGIFAGGMSMLASEEETEVLYTPSNMHRAKDAYKAEGELFAKTDPKARLVYWIAFAREKEGKKANIFTEEVLTELNNINEQVWAIEHNGIKYTDLCFKSSQKGFEDQCDFTGIVDITRARKAANEASLVPYIPSDFFTDPFGSVHPTAVYLGARTNTADGQRVAEARAFAVNIMLDDTKYDAKDLDGWERKMLNIFLDKSKALNSADADWDLAIEVSFSNQEELTASTSNDTTLFIGSFMLVISFSLLITHSYSDSVLAKSQVMNGAVLGIWMAIGSSWGLMGYCGIKFNPVVSFSGFLLLGLGVDDAFVILQSYHNTASALGPEATVQERIGLTFKTAGVSILFTSLTDSLAFAVGSTSVFPSVAAFCQFSAAGVLFLFIYEVVLVGACLALDTHREYSGVPYYMGLVGKGWLWGGVYDHNKNLSDQMPAGSPAPVMAEMRRTAELMGSFGRTLTSNSASAGVFMLYLGYLAYVVVGCLEVGTGLDLRDLASSDSYWTIFIEKRFNYFQEKGITWALLTDKQGLQFAAPGDRSAYMDLVTRLEGMECLFPEPKAVWLREFEEWGKVNSVDVPALSGNDFYQQLEAWLATEQGYQFRRMVILEKTGNDYSISATRARVRMEAWSTTSGDGEGVPCMEEAYDIVDAWHTARESQSKPMISAEVMQFWEASSVIVEQTMFNLMYAALACLVITLVVLPHPLLCLLTMLAVGSILGGVVASMALLYDIRIETISMIHLVLSIGFSIDNVAHYCHAYMTSCKPTRKEKVIDALQRIGMPILAGDVSTMLALLTLLGSTSRIFKSFFFVMFTVLFLGGFHAVVFLPVVLSYFGPLTNPLEQPEPVMEAVKPQQVGAQGQVVFPSDGSSSGSEAGTKDVTEDIIIAKVQSPVTVKRNADVEMA